MEQRAPGSFIFERELHPINAPSLIVLTVSGIETEERPEQKANEELSIVETDEGIEMVLIPSQKLKAYSLILVRLSGRVTVSKDVHPAKRESAISLVPFLRLQNVFEKSGSMETA